MLAITGRGYLDHLGRAITGTMPIANQGDKGTYWIDYEVFFGASLSFNLSLSISNGSNVITLQGANWADLGITTGDTVVWGDIKNFEDVTILSGNSVASIIDGNELTISAPLANTDSGVSGTIYVWKSPQAIKTNMNLIPRDQPSGIQSFIDGSSLTLVNNAIGGMSVSDVLPLTIVGNQSGGAIVSASIERLANSRGGNATNYRVKIVFYWWLYLTNFEDMFFDAETVTPYVFITFLPLWNNPSVSLSGGFKPLNEGNSGFRNENFNQNPNPFTIVGMRWFDGVNQIDGFDYSKVNTFEIEVMSNTGFGAFSGLIFFNDISDSDEYSASQSNNNGDYSILRHTIFAEKANIPVPSSGNSISSYLGTNGEQLTFNIDTSVSGNIMTISGTISGNNAFISKFSDDDNLEKTFAFLVRTESASFGASNYSDTVNLLAWRGVAENYPPILGNYFDGIELHDHADTLIHTY